MIGFFIGVGTTVVILKVVHAVRRRFKAGRLV